MTPEQRQRVEEIRERYALLSIPYPDSGAVKDAALLLSLLDASESREKAALDRVVELGRQMQGGLLVSYLMLQKLGGEVNFTKEELIEPNEKTVHRIDGVDGSFTLRIQARGKGEK